ncbi:hypothetical protein AB6A40_011156 [Gnathostoma spinigerum]|uniref:Uncharacterized protein n=1 Tax=Gnathostoma spinigerum TaxID=75299 RepID=A0ABD6EZ99_9BILA
MQTTRSRRYVLIFAFIICASGVPFAETCAALGPSSQACCPALTQTSNTLGLPDGVLTFTYNNNNCRTQVIATCA